MPLASSGGMADEDKREVVEQKDLLDTTFFIERIGKPFKDKRYHYLKVPCDVTLESGEERVWFARGAAVVNILTDEGTTVDDGLTVTLTKVKGDDPEKEAYYNLEEV